MPEGTRPRRAVVTGGAGFLGSHLCQGLLARGFEVLCLDNFLTGAPANVAHLLERPGFRLVRADVTEYLYVSGPVGYVLHFASPASPVDYLRMPIETLKVGSIGTLHALGLAREKGARFLLASTSEVYGDPQVHPQPETYWGNVNPVGPRGVYDEAKRFAEALTIAYRAHPRRRHGDRPHLQHLRPPHAARRRPRHPDLHPAGAARGGPSPSPATGCRPGRVVYVDDDVDGLLRLLLARSPGPDEHRQPRRVERPRPGPARHRPGRRGRRRSVHVPRPVDDPSVRRPDITLAGRELGWKPTVTIEEGLAATIAWFRTRPGLAG